MKKYTAERRCRNCQANTKQLHIVWLAEIRATCKVCGLVSRYDRYRTDYE